MIKKTHIQGSRVFRQFKELDKGEPRNVVNFFKLHEPSFNELEFREQNHLLAAYGDALFKLRLYKPYLKIADRLIKLSIIQNVRFVQGEDIYHKSLYQKGLAYFHLHDYIASAHIAKELIKMSPEQRSYRNLLRRCMIRQRPEWIKKVLFTGAVMYLLSVLLVILEFAIIARFYEDYQHDTEQIRIGVFVIGLLALTLGELVHHIQIQRKINRHTKAARIKKTTNSAQHENQ